MNPTNKQIEEQREFWANVAKENNWYKEPFFVQIWHNNGTIIDSISFKDMTRDIIINEVLR